LIFVYCPHLYYFISVLVLQEKGIQHYFSYPNSPKTNSNVERLIRSIEEELWLIEGLEYTIDRLYKKLRKYLRIYNFIRPHYGLGLRTPTNLALW